MHNPIEEKSREFYEEAFRVEAKGKSDFYKKDIEIRNRNIKRLKTELEEEENGKRASDAEISEIEKRMGDLDKETKRLLFKDFRAAVSDVLNGTEAQRGGRYGLRIERSGPFIVDRPVSISRDGKRIVEMIQMSILKFRNNEAALIAFQDYMRTAGNLLIDGLTFNELRESINEFFHNAPRPDVYGEEFEAESPVPQSEQPARTGADSLFRF